jgi:PAS domain-containing protein
MEADIIRNQVFPRGYSDQYQKEYVRKDGTIFPIELRTWLFRDKAGTPMGMWALVQDITERKQAQAKLEGVIAELQGALSKVKQLEGMLPICSFCKKIKDDQGNWQRLEEYIGDRSQAEFSHGMCPDCARNQYPEVFSKRTEG